MNNLLPVAAMTSFRRFSAGLLVLLSSALASAQIAPRIERATVSGVDLLLLKTGVQDVVTLQGSLPAGDVFARDANVSIATLTGAMLDQGTTNQDKFAIAEQLEAVGATIRFDVGNDVLNISAKCLREHVPLVVRLLAEQLREPAFDAEEFTRLKVRLSAMIQRQLESTDYRALEAFNQTIYPRTHPNYSAGVREFLNAVQEADLNDVRAFHSRHYGPAGLVLVFVGDIEGDVVRKAVAESFRGWTGGAASVPRPVRLEPSAVAQTQTVRMDDKPSVSIVLGQRTGLRHRDPETLPLRVGTAILGSGFTGRLMATIRDREGLTYGIGAGLTNDTFNDGEWRLRGSFAPELLEQGVASTRRELENWHRDGVTARELDERKTNLAGSFKIQLSTTEGLASTILTALHRGYDLGWIDRYPEEVQALTLDQVNAAIRRHLNPAHMTLVRAGTIETP